MSVASELISRVSKTLFDETHVRWSESEILEYLTDAQRQVAVHKPDAYTKNEALLLVEGSLQTLPADGKLLIDVINNEGGDGLTPGNSISQIDRVTLDQYMPDWRAASSSVVCQHFIYDDRDPKHFYVYPPQPATPEYVRVTYCAIPPVVSSSTDNLVVDEDFDVAMYYLCLARAYAKSTSTQDLVKSQSYQSLGIGIITGQKVPQQEIHPTQIAERAER